jgi:hypothetical protein
MSKKSTRVKIIEPDGDMPPEERLAPFILAMFGLGWLIGAGASWYWGALMLAGSLAWQFYRGKRRKHNQAFRTFIGEESEEE